MSSSATPPKINPLFQTFRDVPKKTIIDNYTRTNVEVVREGAENGFVEFVITDNKDFNFENAPFSDEDADYEGDYRPFAGQLTGSYSISGKDAWIDSVYVPPPQRRQGLMNILFCNFIQWLRTNKPYIEHVRLWDATGIGLWREKQGFEKRPGISAEIADIGDLVGRCGLVGGVRLRRRRHHKRVSKKKTTKRRGRRSQKRLRR